LRLAPSLGHTAPTPALKRGVRQGHGFPIAPPDGTIPSRQRLLNLTLTAKYRDQASGWVKDR
jgi:hypothetical protein